MAGEKTEKATPKRKQDERKKGNIFKSTEVVTVFSLVALFYIVKLLSNFTFESLQLGMTDFFNLAGMAPTLDGAVMRDITVEIILVFAKAAGPILLAAGFVTIVLTGAQTRFLVSFKALSFKGNRINPISGFKKMFSVRGVVELVKSLLKITVLVVICYNNIMSSLTTMPRLMDMSLEQTMMVVGEIIMSILNSLIPIFVIISIGDYIYQWWDYEKNLRMSKQEIKEEYKQTEGDPQIKGKIRERQQQQARTRMMQAVPTADVIIRNPTHYAVAVKYDSEKDNAPIVVAKGADLVAFRIIEIAKENNVMMVENRPLARGLYESVDLEREIPPDFYQAVAEVIAFVYSVREKEKNKI